MNNSNAEIRISDPQVIVSDKKQNHRKRVREFKKKQDSEYIEVNLKVTVLLPIAIS